MDKKDSYMDDLFRAAREETPKRSLKAVQAGFMASLGPGGASGGTAAGGASGTGGSTLGLWTIKTLIMTTLILTTAALIFNIGGEAQTSYEIRSSEPIEISNYSDLLQEKTANAVETESEPPSVPEKELETQEPTSIAPNSETIPKPANVAPVKNPIQVINPVSTIIVKATMVEEREVVFQISNSTTEEELAEMKRQAEEAGIAFDYRTKGSLKKLTLDMSLDGEEGKQESSVSVNGTFDFSIGWILDDEGRALRFWNGLSDEEGISICVDHEKNCCKKDHEDCASVSIFDGTHWAFSDEEGELEMFADRDWEEGDDEEDTMYLVISEQTEEAELEEMKDEALKAGVLFEFKHNAGSNSFYQIMFVSESGRQTKRIEVTEEEFTVELGWHEDEEGRAYRFAE